MQILFNIIISLVAAWACSHYAKKKGRNPSIWFIAGAFFGILALVALFLFPLRKVKAVPQPSQPSLRAIDPSHSEKLWYYLDEKKEQFGPMSFPALMRAWREGLIKEESFVWNEELDNWKFLKDVTTGHQGA